MPLRISLSACDAGVAKRASFSYPGRYILSMTTSSCRARSAFRNMGLQEHMPGIRHSSRVNHVIVATHQCSINYIFLVEMAQTGGKDMKSPFSTYPIL